MGDRTCTTPPDDRLSSESFNQGYCDRFFIQEGLLGRGGRGEVVKVRHVLDGISLGVFALKRVVVGDSHSWLIKTLREVQLLKHLKLVSYNHVWLEMKQSSFGPRVPVLHILQEYCDGDDLESHVLRICGKTEPTVKELEDRCRSRSKGRIPQPDPNPSLSIDCVFSFFKNILAGLAFLHEHGVAHRDMKPSNCLLDFRTHSESGHPRVLIADFGEARIGSSDLNRTGGTGTLSFMAPEVLRGEPWTQAADLFSLGMILYFLTHEGQLPYHANDNNFEGLQQEILQFRGCSFRCGTNTLGQVDLRELEKVVLSFLSPDPIERLSCQDLLLLVQLHDRPLHKTSKSALSTRHSSRSTLGKEIISRWSPISSIGMHLMVIPSNMRRLTITSEERRKTTQSISLVHPNSQMNAWFAALYTRGEYIATLVLVLRVSIIESILLMQDALGLFMLPLLAVSICESSLCLPFYRRLTNTVGMVFLAWALTCILF